MVIYNANIYFVDNKNTLIQFETRKKEFKIIETINTKSFYVSKVKILFLRKN